MSRPGGGESSRVNLVGSTAKYLLVSARGAVPRILLDDRT